MNDIFPKICDWHELSDCKFLETISLVVKDALFFLTAHKYTITSAMMFKESVYRLKTGISKSTSQNKVEY